MAMNEWLAQVYNTNGEAEKTAEETQKLANAELFAKIASKHGLDLSQMSAEQKGQLYAQVFPEEATKVAADNGDEDKGDDNGEKKEPPPFAKKEEEEKEAAAQAHFQEKRAFQEKFAEADLMGRVMAHSFTDELNKIKTATGEKTAQEKCPECGKEDCKCPAAKEEAKEGSAPETAAVPAAAPAGIPKNANAAAFEELAARRAIEMAKEAGYDPEQAFQRINALFTLGLEESEKVASVQDYEAGLHIRALEYLEKAGAEVKWEEVLGK